MVVGEVSAWASGEQYWREGDVTKCSNNFAAFRDSGLLDQTVEA